jgi:hypothetical protein
MSYTSLGVLRLTARAASRSSLGVLRSTTWVGLGVTRSMIGGLEMFDEPWSRLGEGVVRSTISNFEREAGHAIM